MQKHFILSGEAGYIDTHHNLNAIYLIRCSHFSYCNAFIMLANNSSIININYGGVIGIGHNKQQVACDGLHFF